MFHVKWQLDLSLHELDYNSKHVNNLSLISIDFECKYFFWHLRKQFFCVQNSDLIYVAGGSTFFGI